MSRVKTVSEPDIHEHGRWIRSLHDGPDLMHRARAGQNMVKTFSKSEAVARAAEMEGQVLGTLLLMSEWCTDPREVEKENEELTALLRAPSPFVLGCNPTRQRPNARPRTPTETERRRPNTENAAAHIAVWSCLNGVAQDKHRKLCDGREIQRGQDVRRGPAEGNLRLLYY